MEMTPEIYAKIIDTSTKVNLMLFWMKAGGVLILTQIITTVVGIVRNGNGKKK
jgi:hypothetical protein